MLTTIIGNTRYYDKKGDLKAIKEIHCDKKGKYILCRSRKYYLKEEK